MFIRNFEISPTLLRDFLGHRLLMREQTSWGKYPCWSYGNSLFLIAHFIHRGLESIG